MNGGLGSNRTPSDLFTPYPPEPMTMWPVSTRVNTPKNDDADLLTPTVDPSEPEPPRGNSS